MTEYEKAVAYWQKRNISTDAELAEALNGHSITFAYHSGKIENDKITYHDTREIFEHDGVTSYTGDLRTLFEMRNARDAHEFSLSAFQKRTPLDENFLKKLHKISTQNTYDARRWQLGERPGEYKLHDYVTGRNEIGALPEDVAEEVVELLAEISDISGKNVLTAAAYFHVKLENIHPFADGNGRIGRLAMNYLLICNNHPPIVIHAEDRKAYYDALEAWDTDQNLEPMMSFLMAQTAKTWKKQVARAEKRGALDKNTDSVESSISRDTFEKYMDKKLKSISADYIDLTSGDIHRSLGGYPGKNHSMPICCDVMYQKMRGDDVILHTPLKGKGATVTIRYFKRNHP